MAVFGWFMLVLILLGGLGAVAYVFLFNKKDTAQTIAVPADAAVAPEPATPPVKDEPKVKKPKTKPETEPKVEPKVQTPPEAGSAADEAPAAEVKTPAQPKTPKAIGIAATATPKQISDVAKKAEAKGDWDAARLAYERLEQAKGYQYPGFAVYKQAYSAFKAKDTSEAMTLAMRASTMDGNQKFDAKLLYADAVMQQGDYARAKQFLIGLRKQVDAKKKATVADKIAACNKKLGLPAKDGVD
jgi:hypothetical protein